MAEVRAKKALGQHFLVDLNIARKICDALSVVPAAGSAPDRSDTSGPVLQAHPASGHSDTSGPVFQTHPASDRSGTSGPVLQAHPASGPVPPAGSAASAAPAPADVLEVGCGMGVLTQFLLRLWGAEIDPESVAYLHVHYPEFAPRLIEGDFLKMDLAVAFPRGVRIIGNFPYNISSQIFFKILEHRDLIPECVGMIQREVAVRLAESPGSKEYGILSVLLQAWYDIEYLFTVGEKVFNPPPKVKSAVVRLRRNDTQCLDCDERLFVRVVKASFGQRRKMIRNSLRAAFGDFGGTEHPFFSRRAEQLSVDEFVELTRWVAARL